MNELNATTIALAPDMIIHKDDILLSLLTPLRRWLIILSLPEDKKLLSKLPYSYYIIYRKVTPRLVAMHPFLILDKNKKWTSYHFDSITDIVFYNQVSMTQHDMIIQLVNRIGRENNLKIFYF